MINGTIIKGIGSFYGVLTETGELKTCKVRGLFRKKQIVPTVGDHVLVENQLQGYDLIMDIMPRRNILKRPPVANIDRLFLVVAASRPAPDFLLIDQMIIEAKRLGIDTVPVMNKTDEADDRTLEQFREDYSRFRIQLVSAKTGDGLENLRKMMQDCVCCFAGQSAVGKSSLLNALFAGLDLEVGSLSRKTEHGKHTTRHAELLPFSGGAVVDTPGFSLYETEPFEQSELNSLYPEFEDIPFPCRYQDCMHDTEPDCGVKALLEQGGITADRYQRYLSIAKDNLNRRKHRYD